MISADSFQKSFFDWEAVRYDIDQMLRKDPFTCQACSPDMFQFQWMETANITVLRMQQDLKNRLFLRTSL
ncbi:hypothetical protein AMECASPLE_038383 [Ameca splendens]|uniref:Uncharacterized protein n=1 Tax=Ameca splendens TaxID=208324 RepID=A0ABV0ZH95_9TELE